MQEPLATTTADDLDAQIEQTPTSHFLMALRAHINAQQPVPSIPTLHRYMRGEWPAAVRWLLRYPPLLRALADDAEQSNGEGSADPLNGGDANHIIEFPSLVKSEQHKEYLP